MAVGLRHLQFVVAAARHRSLRQAAGALGVRQSTLSRTIRQVEDRLGVILFVRSNRGVQPTTAGIQFVETAAQLLRDLDGLVSTAKSLGRGEAGNLTLGLLSSFSMEQLRQVVVDYANECPEVDIRLVSRPRSALLTGLDADTLDLAIVVGHVSRSDYESMSLWSERVLVAVSEAHPLRGSNFVSWTDLKNETILLSSRGIGSDLKNMSITKLAAIGDRPKIEEHAVGAEALLSLVAAGRGITLQCEGAVRAAHAGIVHLEVHDGSGPNWLTYSACWKKQHINPALASFLALLRAHCSMISRGRAPGT